MQTLFISTHILLCQPIIAYLILLLYAIVFYCETPDKTTMQWWNEQ